MSLDVGWGVRCGEGGRDIEMGGYDGKRKVKMKKRNAKL